MIRSSSVVFLLLLSPYISPLESHNGIPQNQRHSPRQKLPRLQKRKKHRNLHNIKRTLFQDADEAFTVRVMEKPEEVKSLLEAGFEYVCQKDNLIFLGRRK
jgi:hypothetical protein